MKKIISKLLITIIFLIFPFVALGTDGYDYDYYYSGGKKVFLKRNPDKVCVLTPKTNTNLTEHSLIGTYDFFDYNIVENNVLLSRSLDYDESLTLPCFISNSGKEIILTEYIDIKLKNKRDINLLQSIAKENNLRIVKQDEFMPLWWLLSITPQTKKTTIAIANELFESGFFVEVCPNFHSNSGFESISWDKHINKQWGLHNINNDTVDINISSAWNLATGKNVAIAVIDNGIDITHPDLKDNIFLSCNANTSSDSVIYDCISAEHGTHVTGIIAGIRNNDIGIAGVAPDSKILAISSQMNPTSITFAINWAIHNNAEIINCSFSYPTISSKVEEAFDSALYRGRNGKGCIIIKSAGNNGTDSITYPGSYRREVLVVGNITQLGKLSTSSNYGADLDVVAPGNHIYSTYPNAKYSSQSGTSMSTPFVSGLAALILERNPNLTGQQVRDIIEQNTTKVGDMPYTTVPERPNGTWNEKYGYGLIDAYKALMATPRKEENY